MAYTVKIERIGGADTLTDAPRVYEARDEADAHAIAAYEVDGSKPDRPRIATVSDATGRLLFTYYGRADETRT